MVQAWHLGVVGTLLLVLSYGQGDRAASAAEDYVLYGDRFGDLERAARHQLYSTILFWLALGSLMLAAWTWHRHDLRRQVGEAVQGALDARAPQPATPEARPPGDRPG